MATRRNERLPQVIKEELSQIIQRYVEMAPGTLLTITKVELANEGKRVDIYFTFFPREKELDILSVLRKQEKDLQRHLNERLTLQHVPKLHFIFDKGEQLRQRTEELFEEIEQEDSGINE